jgi:hypothetical protein
MLVIRAIAVPSRAEKYVSGGGAKLSEYGTRRAKADSDAGAGAEAESRRGAVPVARFPPLIKPDGPISRASRRHQDFKTGLLGDSRSTRHSRVPPTLASALPPRNGRQGNGKDLVVCRYRKGTSIPATIYP